MSFTDCSAFVMSIRRRLQRMPSCALCGRNYRDGARARMLRQPMGDEDRRAAAGAALFQALDAYSSATMMCILVLAGRVIAFVSRQGMPRPLPGWVEIVQVILSVAGLAFLVATRRRPRPGIALAICVVLLAPFLAIVPYNAV